jgi:hypothetical protein
VSHDVEIALISGLLAGGFAVLSAAVTVASTGRRDERRARTETALELPDVSSLIWQPDYTALNAALTRHEARLAVAGVSGDLIDALAKTSRACWHDNRETRDQGNEPGGINVAYLEANRAVQKAILAQLIRKPGRRARRELRRTALEGASSALREWKDPEWF